MRPIPQDTKEDSPTIIDWGNLSNNTINFDSLTFTTPYGRLCNDLEDVLEEYDVSKRTKRHALAMMIAEMGVDE